MSRVGRGYPPPEAYDDRPRRRGGRDYQEVDVDVRESDYRRAPPEYLREDYGRPSHAGPMVVRERTEVDYDQYEQDRSRPPPRSRGNGEEIDINIRETDYSRAPPRSRRGGQDREDIEVDYRDRSRGPRDYDRETVYVREDGDRRGPPPRNSEREEIIIRRDTEEAPPPPRSSNRRDQSRTRVNVDIRDDEGEQPRAPPYPRSRSRAPPGDDEEIDVKISRADPNRSRARDTGNTLAVRESSRTRRRSMPPPRNLAREREDFVYRRRSPSRPPRETEEIVIRQRKNSSPSPSPSPPAAPTPPPPPPPQVETRPPIVQEVITHHRHIDHGVVHAPRSPESSPSPPPPQRRKQDVEVDIRRTDARGNTTEEDIRVRDNESSGRNSQRDREAGHRVSRRRSLDSTPGPIVRRSNKEETNINVNIDADFGNSNPDRRLAAPGSQKPREMWTEVTKDLVSREAVEAEGYQYEETEDFFYVMAYLRYEDVARLVDITQDMRYGRRERIEQIQWERQDPRISRDSRPPRRGGPPPDRYDGWDEVTHDREVTYEDRSRRGHR